MVMDNMSCQNTEIMIIALALHVPLTRRQHQHNPPGGNGGRSLSFFFCTCLVEYHDSYGSELPMAAFIIA